jgi:adenine-specific DNA-methyltransferase
MPKLDWIGKEKILTHHEEIPYHPIHCHSNLSVRGDESNGDLHPAAGNLLVQADNLLALKSLLPFYKGQIKIIYIDPPYNTGNENWIYNDNVNSPEIQKWLGKVVGDEEKDLCRHDKWLCMMYPRLRLLKELLRPDGAIFVSIDDNEIATARLLLDEIFGYTNFIGQFCWKRRASSAMADRQISVDHEYVIAYGASKDFFFRGTPKDYDRYKNPDNDPEGPWVLGDLTVGMGKDLRPNQFYDLVDPKSGITYPPNPNRVWAYIPDSMARLIEKGSIVFPKDPNKRPMIKRYLKKLKADANPISTWILNPNEKPEEESTLSLFSGLNAEATRLQRAMFGEQVFAYSKPNSLLRHIIAAATTDDDIILDSFAGSGTTGHAVLQMNAQDGANRRFILVELENEIASKVTAKRLEQAITGYGGTPGLGGAFSYCTLGEPLYDEVDGGIRRDTPWRDLAHHLLFARTREPLARNTGAEPPFIARIRGVSYFLLWKGDPHSRGGGEASPLDLNALLMLRQFPGPKVIWASKCGLAESRLSRENIAFEQIPYALQDR